MPETIAGHQEVIIELLGAEYGIRADSVKEIVRLVEITPIPESSPSVKGAIDYRGNVAVVVDMALRLGLKPAPYDLNTQIVIVETSAGLTGLIVERVVDVMTIETEAVLMGRESSMPDELTTGAFEDGDRLVILLDISRLVRVKKRKASRE